MTSISMQAPLLSSSPAGGLGGLLAALSLPWSGFRPELQLHPQSETVTLEDPQSGDLFELSPAEAEVVRRSAQAPSNAQVHCFEAIIAEGVLSAAELKQFLQQCQQQGLCRQQPAQAKSASWSLMWRLSLWRPQPFLEYGLPKLAPLFSPYCGLLMGLLALASLIGITPQLELYLSTANYLATPAGVLLFMLSLLLLKFGHELAHAFTAARLGVPVRQIGVLFILIWPLLYTDVTDAWKLPDRRQRARIALAGIRFELCVAAVAGCLWLLLPDGLLRSLAFIFSGTALVSSLLINLNPLMRFDGYYALMDWWGIANLQQQAYSHCQQWRRHRMWGSEAPVLHPQLLCYGWAAWAWRWLIAVAIIALVWKSLGAAIAIVTAVFFMRGLVWQPLQQEWRFLASGGLWLRQRSKRTWSLALLILLLLLLPLPRSINIAATLSAADQYHHALPLSAQLDTKLPVAGQQLDKGSVLFSFSQAALARDIALATQEQQLRQRQYDALLLTGEQGGLRKTAGAELARAQQDLQRLQQQQQSLQSKALDAAVVMTSNEQLRPGDTVAAGETILVTANPNAAQLDLFLSQRQLSLWSKHVVDELHIKLANGQRISQALAPLKQQPQFQIKPPSVLTDIAGGPIATRVSATGQLEALGSWYQLTVPLAQAAPFLNMPAKVKVRLGYRSLAARLFDALIS
jgi:putative peptide zinc metalloprotease protein